MKTEVTAYLVVSGLIAIGAVATMKNNKGLPHAHKSLFFLHLITILTSLKGLL